MLHAILRLCFTVIITMLVMVTVIGPARASTAVQDAIERLNIGDNHGALAIADRGIEQGPSPDLQLIRGYALLGLNQIDAAKHAVIAARASKQRYQYLMLRGHILAHEGHHNMALMWYRRAYDLAPDATAKRLALTAGRDEKNRRHWIWSADFSIRSSDNLNLSTRDETVMLLGLPFTLSPNARATSGREYNASLTSRYKVSQSETHLTTAGLALSAQRRDGSPQTINGITLSFDTVWKVQMLNAPKTITFSAIQRRPDIKNSHSQVQSASMSVAGQIDDRLGWSVGIGVVADNSETWENRTKQITASMTYFVRPGLNIGLYAAQSQTTSDLETQKQKTTVFRPFLTYRCEGCAVDFDIFSELSTVKYDEPTPLFGVVRADRLQQVGVTATFNTVTFFGMSPYLSVKHTKRSSNIGLYDAEARDVFVGFKSVF